MNTWNVWDATKFGLILAGMVLFADAVMADEIDGIADRVDAHGDRIEDRGHEEGVNGDPV